jgi:hypothetical protein
MVDPPDAAADEDEGEGEVDRGLVLLQDPETAGRLVGDQLPEVVTQASTAWQAWKLLIRPA